MTLTTTPPADIDAPWSVLDRPDEIAVVTAYGEPVAACPRSNVLDERVVRQRLELAAAAPDLLRLARSAVCSFEEHLSVLRDALSDTTDPEDIEDQIGNYEHLLAEHRRVLVRLEGR